MDAVCFPVQELKEVWVKLYRGSDISKCTLTCGYRILNSVSLRELLPKKKVLPRPKHQPVSPLKIPCDVDRTGRVGFRLFGQLLFGPQ